MKRLLNVMAPALAVLAGACSPDAPTHVDIPATPALSVEPAGAAGWTPLAPKGAGGTNLNASVYIPEADVVIAGFMPDYGVGELWRFSLRTNSWSRLPASNWPSGKYRRLVHDPVRRRLITYWDGLGQVYTIPEGGGQWTPDGSAGNQDHYYEAYPFWNPVSRRLSIFGGYGFGTWKDDLLAWDGNDWSGVAQSNVRPEARFGTGSGSVAVDGRGARVFLGQRHRGAAGGNYDDLWTLDLRSGQWRELIPPSSDSAARTISPLAYVPRTRQLFRFGGCRPIDDPGLCTNPSGELLVTIPDHPSPRWKRISDGPVSPSGRYAGALYYDARRHRLILMGGHGANGWQDDVWSRALR